MPIEIKELVIRVTLDNQDTVHGASGGGGGASPAAAPDAGTQHAIVQECVRQVLLILARERER